MYSFCCLLIHTIQQENLLPNKKAVKLYSFFIVLGMSLEQGKEALFLECFTHIIPPSSVYSACNISLLPTMRVAKFKTSLFKVLPNQHNHSRTITYQQVLASESAIPIFRHQRNITSLI